MSHLHSIHLKDTRFRKSLLANATHTRSENVFLLFQYYLCICIYSIHIWPWPACAAEIPDHVNNSEKGRNHFNSVNLKSNWSFFICSWSLEWVWHLFKTILLCKPDRKVKRSHRMRSANATKLFSLQNV